MYYSDFNCFGRKLEDVSKVTFLMNVENAVSGFLKSWDSLKERICQGGHIARKDEQALKAYCALYVHYICEIGLKDGLNEFEDYLYLLIAIQTKLKASHLLFDEMIIIDSVTEESDDDCENELLKLIGSINETIRLSWGKTKYRLENLSVKENISKLADSNEKVLHQEQAFLKIVEGMSADETDFTLKEALEHLRYAFGCYEGALTDMKAAHKELSLTERQTVNSPEKCCEYAKEIYLEQSKTMEDYAIVIFNNGTAVTGVGYSEDVEEIKNKAKKYLAEVCKSGDAVDIFEEKEFDDEILYNLTRIGYGVCNYYMQQKDCYFDIDEEIARENRRKDNSELIIRYIVHNGEVIFDSEK